MALIAQLAYTSLPTPKVPSDSLFTAGVRSLNRSKLSSFVGQLTLLRVTSAWGVPVRWPSALQNQLLLM